MIKAEVNKTQTHIEVKGTLADIAAEIGIIVNSIYKTIRRRKTGEVFKCAMQCLMEENAPTWHAIPSGTGVYMEMPQDGGVE